MGDKQYSILVPPASEPVTAAEVFRYLRQVAGGEDDALMPRLIGAAREFVELYTGRAMITQQWQLQQPSWDANRIRFQLQYATYYGGLSADFWGQYESSGQWPTARQPEITLDRSPLQSVQSVAIWPADGTGQVTLTAGVDYMVDTQSTPGKIVPFPGTSVPPVYLRPDAITINFTSGYGAAAAVPNALALCVDYMAAHFYDQRAIISESRSIEDVPYTLTSLLQQQKVRGMIA